MLCHLGGEGRHFEMRTLLHTVAQNNHHQQCQRNLSTRFSSLRKRPGTYRCHLCAEDIASGHNSTGNLGRHLESVHADAYRHAHEEVADPGTKRAQLEDLARNSEAKRARQGTMESFVIRLEKDVENTTREAFWMLWLNKRGIAYDAIQDPLFHLARQVQCLKICVRVLTPILEGQSSCSTTLYMENHQGINAWCHL